jgi:hypothetical protein
LPHAAVEPHIFCKDVGGPYLMAECLYIPLQMLIEAGYPADRLHLIMLDRDPRGRSPRGSPNGRIVFRATCWCATSSSPR